MTRNAPGDTGETRPAAAQSRRWILIAAAALVVAALIVWAVVASGRAQGPAVGPSPTGTPPTSAPGAQPPSPSPGSASQTPGAQSPTMTTSPAPIETAPAPRETLPPVALDATAEPVAGIRVELASIESVSGEANLAGEVGGPALRVTLEARNDSVSAFATPGVVVNLYFGDDGAPAGGIREPGGREFPSSVGSGETASGVFLFTVPEDARESILIEVDLQVGEPVVLFEGSVD